MKRILIVDEERWFLEAIIDVLESKDYEIDFVYNCSESITQFLNNTYDHIILDLMLPVGDYEITKDIITDDGNLMFGIQLLKYFRTQNKKVNIIGFSVANTNEIRQAFTDANAAYICKIEANSYEKIIRAVIKL